MDVFPSDIFSLLSVVIFDEIATYMERFCSHQLTVRFEIVTLKSGILDQPLIYKKINTYNLTVYSI
jgi:hypothetical protein